MAQSDYTCVLGFRATGARSLAEQGIQLRIFETCQSAAADWQLIQPEQNRFLSLRYLKVLELYPPKGFRFRYLIFYKEDRPVGLAYCQWLHFKAADSVQESIDPSGSTWLQRLGHYCKQLIVRQIEFSTLVCGNILLTGMHGVYFKPNAIPEDRQLAVLDQGLQQLANEMNRTGTKVTGIGLKDFGEVERARIFEPGDSPYAEFCFLPSMELELPAHWKAFEDYLSDLTSKYRVRVRRAMKKAARLSSSALSAEDIRMHQARLYALYQAVADKATVNLVQLHPDYFYGLKRTFDEDFQLVAYFDEQEEIVGFFTLLRNGAQLEAHFLGLDSDVNADTQLYLNMLLEMIATGIQWEATSIHFARTAMEIKSSVGARAQDMYCYVRHRKSLPNRLFMPFLRRLTPANEEWVARHPFGEGTE